MKNQSFDDFVNWQKYDKFSRCIASNGDPISSQIHAHTREVANSCMRSCVGLHELDCGEMCNGVGRNEIICISAFIASNRCVYGWTCVSVQLFFHTYIRRSHQNYTIFWIIQHVYVQNETKRSCDNKRQMKFDCTLYKCLTHKDALYCVRVCDGFVVGYFLSYSLVEWHPIQCSYIR